MPSAQLGKARRINDAAGRYIEFCKSTFPNDLDLRGLKTGGGLRARRHLSHRPARVSRAGRRRHRDRRATRRYQHQPRMRRHPSASACQARCRTHRAAPRHRVRWRWRPAGHGGSATARSTTATSCCYVIARFRHEAEAAEGRGGRHADDQSRHGAGAGPARHSVRARGGRRPLRAGKADRERAGSSAGRTPGTSSASTSTPPATASSRRCRCCMRCRCRRQSARSSCAGDVRLYPQVLVNVKTRKGFDFAADGKVQAGAQGNARRS